jgi:hypothetical protein
MPSNARKMAIIAVAFALWTGEGDAQTAPAAPGRDLSIGTGTFAVRNLDFDLWPSVAPPAVRKMLRRSRIIAVRSSATSSITSSRCKRIRNCARGPIAIRQRPSAEDRTAFRKSVKVESQKAKIRDGRETAVHDWRQIPSAYEADRHPIAAGLSPDSFFRASGLGANAARADGPASVHWTAAVVWAVWNRTHRPHGPVPKTPDARN